ncbi:TusE/DsrC/DsvC family sulfur relay protein [Marinicella sp. W31]|uniref:TusE/DsrC/DsvC family sulfur relay protein n=1 Tax=Marinicella sp. W31 TaxID=3023713 RepID=UPI003756A719
MEIDQLKKQLDSDGHLIDASIWTEAIAQQLAELDALNLTPEHFEILKLVQDLYAETHDTPPMRLLVKQIKIRLGEEKGNSRHLYRLFPEGPVRYASKYAGLPKPAHCM